MEFSPKLDMHTLPKIRYIPGRINAVSSAKLDRSGQFFQAPNKKHKTAKSSQRFAYVCQITVYMKRGISRILTT